MPLHRSNPQTQPVTPRNAVQRQQGIPAVPPPCGGRVGAPAVQRKQATGVPAVPPPCGGRVGAPAVQRKQATGVPAVPPPCGGRVGAPAVQRKQATGVPAVPSPCGGRVGAPAVQRKQATGVPGRFGAPAGHPTAPARGVAAVVQRAPKKSTEREGEHVDPDYPLLRLVRLSKGDGSYGEYRIVGTETKIYDDPPHWYSDSDGINKLDLSEYVGDPTERGGVANNGGKSFYYLESAHTGGFFPVMVALQLATQLNKEKDQTFTEWKVQAVADEIRQKKTVHPIVVRETSEGFRLVDGRHRIAASALCGLQSVPYNLV